MVHGLERPGPGRGGGSGGPPPIFRPPARPHAAGSIPPEPPDPPCQPSPQLRGRQCPSVESWRGPGPRGGSCDPELGGVQPGASRQGLEGGPGAPWTSPRAGSGAVRVLPPATVSEPPCASERAKTHVGGGCGGLGPAALKVFELWRPRRRGQGPCFRGCLSVCAGVGAGPATGPLPDLAPRVCFVSVNKRAFLLLSPSHLLYGASYWR